MSRTGACAARLLIAMLLVLPIAGGAAVGESIVILHTNDLHLRLGRLASIEGWIARERAAEPPRPVLLLDAGDAWQDFRRPIAAVWGAEEMVDWMNRVGYDAMAIGNHDLYWESDGLTALAAAAGFSLLCANLVPEAGFDPPFAASIVKPVGDRSILVVGLIGPEFVPFASYPRLRYRPPDEALRDELARSADVDLTIVIAHLPVADAVRIVERVPEIDVFVTGHSHETTPEPIVVGETIVVQAGAFGRWLGRLEIRLDDAADGARIVAHDYRLLPTETAPVDVDRGRRRLLHVLLALAGVALLTFL